MTSKEIHINSPGFTDAFSAWADEFVDDYDWPGIRDEYNVRLQELAPDGVAWGWAESGPWCRAGISVDEETVWDRWQKIEDEDLIDFETIAGHHQLPVLIPGEPQLYQDNAGMYHLGDGARLWTAAWYPDDLTTAREAWQLWLDGEGTPNENDGWLRVRFDATGLTKVRR